MISPRALNESLDRVLLLSTPLKPETDERSLSKILLSTNNLPLGLQLYSA